MASAPTTTEFVCGEARAPSGLAASSSTPLPRYVLSAPGAIASGAFFVGMQELQSPSADRVLPARATDAAGRVQRSLGWVPDPVQLRAERWRCLARASAGGRCSRALPRHRRGDPGATSARRWRRRAGAQAGCSWGRPTHRTSRRVRGSALPAIASSGAAPGPPGSAPRARATCRSGSRRHPRASGCGTRCDPARTGTTGHQASVCLGGRSD